jgi:hypothetical protein
MHFKTFILTISAVFAIQHVSFATIINFDDQGYTGPSLFMDASPIPQHLEFTTADGWVKIDGGVILENTSFLPANQTALYGTASFVNGMTNPLTITFENDIENFYMDLYNGYTTDMTYVISDNNGHTSTFTLPSNLNSGTTLVEFAAVGNVLTIESTTLGQSNWDFFIDNLHFNEKLPSSVPEPSMMMLLGFGLVSLVFYRKKR